MSIEYVIIQAGGQGTRLERLTSNKPKALVSIFGKPMILHLMDRMPKAHFIVIGDYKRDVLEKYLRLFATAQFTVIPADGTKTCAGIQQAIKLIPEKTPFLITWCDLFFEKDIIPENLDPHTNYIGLSKDFPCRWSFQNGTLNEVQSSTHGVAGVFVFKDTSEIVSVPQSGEFCRYLKESSVSFEDFYIENASEVGTKDSYNKVTAQYAQTRPFNSIEFKEDTVVKKPLNEQGKKLALDEVAWYKYIENRELSFIPKIFAYDPLIARRIVGVPLHKAQLSEFDKSKVLASVISNLQQLHALQAIQFPAAYANNKEAILDKTKTRLDSIATVVPHMHDECIVINGKKCINFYKQWNLVEALCEPYLHQKTYHFIHGDLTFSNSMYEEGTQKVYFIDPRGYYGTSKLFGDADYDWAKLYYSLKGNYDQFNSKNFVLLFDNDQIDIRISSSGWEVYSDFLFSKINVDRSKIEVFHAIIWLSLSSYAWDDYDSICGAFYNGILLMQECYEKTL